MGSTQPNASAHPIRAIDRRTARRCGPGDVNGPASLTKHLVQIPPSPCRTISRRVRDKAPGSADVPVPGHGRQLLRGQPVSPGALSRPEVYSWPYQAAGRRSVRLGRRGDGTGTCCDPLEAVPSAPSLLVLSDRWSHAEKGSHPATAPLLQGDSRRRLLCSTSEAHSGGVRAVQSVGSLTWCAPWDSNPEPAD